MLSATYIALAILMLTLAYPQPSYSGLVAPPGFKTLLYLDNPMLAVFSSDRETLVYVENRAYIAGFKAIASCYDGVRVLLLLDNSSLYSVDVKSGRAAHLTLLPEVKATSVSCSPSRRVIAGVSGGEVVVVDIDSSLGYVLRGLSSPSPMAYVLDNNLYILLGGNRVVGITEGEATLYSLPEVASIKGLAFSEGELVAYGSWLDSGLVYRFNVGDALLISVPGRVTSVDSMVCMGYRCQAIVIPRGDWPVIVEFSMWRYVAEARILGVKPFVYHDSGASNTPWISGEFIGLGVAVVGVKSTRSSVIGFNWTHALAWVEGYVTPSPRLSKVKVFPTTSSLNITRFSVEVRENSLELEPSNITVKAVSSQVDRLDILVSLATVSSPLIAYLLGYYVSSPRRSTS